jgi:hypothetical protein|tara:strand:+ start:1205 stop:2062 length:858 start_codon:yes stop_codon:yes gene_type:complete
MDFLKDLHEARMTRNDSDQKSLTYTDVCEKLYLHLLVLELLKNYDSAKPFVKMYAQKTTTHDSYKHFRIHATDLYNLIYFATGDKAAIDKLKNPGAAQKQRDTTQLPVLALNRYITNLKSSSSINESQLFMKLETALKVSLYKDLRRNITSIKRLSPQQLKETVTKLLFACRAKLRNSDIISELETLAANKDLERYNVKDTEPKVSTPDLLPSTKELARYRYIVGQTNLVLTKQLIDNAKAGRGATSQQLKAYIPAMEIIDDIVTGGPTYIQQLKNIQKRAKDRR